MTYHKEIFIFVYDTCLHHLYFIKAKTFYLQRIKYNFVILIFLFNSNIQYFD